MQAKIQSALPALAFLRAVWLDKNPNNYFLAVLGEDGIVRLFGVKED